MSPRLSAKPDSSFFRKIAIGAVGARAVRVDLQHCGHAVFELENGSTDTRIWKNVKRKRVRIPDLVCAHCGLRVESRAKTKPELAMSHSPTDAERAWDFGMVDSDVIAFPICRSIAETAWSRGELEQNQSYWHSQDRIRWKTRTYINYIRVGAFRQVLHSRSSTKGVVEGSETSIVWDAVFSTREGTVEAVRDGKISVRRASDAHLYTWQNRKQLPVVVGEGDVVQEVQILAAPVDPLGQDELQCPRSMGSSRLPEMLSSPERTQRFTGIKLARLREEPVYAQVVDRITHHPDEDIYVRLEGTVYLTRVCGRSARRLIGPYLESMDEQTRLEAVVALAESGTAESVEMLSGVLDRQDAPLFLRSAAAWALGRIGTERAAERLIQAFADVSSAVREEALEAIGSVGEPALGQLLAALMGDEQAIAAGSAEAIRRQNLLPQEAVDDVVKAIQGDPGQHWAVWLLGSLSREKEYFRSAIAELQDSRPEAHYAVTVLWSFMESWIARHWELRPGAEA